MVTPAISPLSGASRGGPLVADVPPPRNFRPLKGSITDVRIGGEKSLSRQLSAEMSLAKIAGLKYEKAFLESLRAQYATCYIQPHIHFRDDGAYRTVIPDAVLFVPSKAPQIVVFEVKSQHMPEAWWQLEKLYIPVIRAGFPSYEIRGVEVCRTYDPQMPWPGSYVVYNDLDDCIVGVQRLGVLRWRKR